jgi:hypothetical protein
VCLCERGPVNQRRTGASRRNFGLFPGSWVVFVYRSVFIARRAARGLFVFMVNGGARRGRSCCCCCCVRTHNNKMGLCALSLRSLNSVHSLLRSNFALPWRPQTGRKPNPHRAPSMTPALGIRVRVLILTPSILSLSSLSPLHTECVIASLLHLAPRGILLTLTCLQLSRGCVDAFFLFAL